MTIAVLSRPDAAVIGDDADVLSNIAKADVHLAVWRRALPQALSGLATFDWGTIENIDEPVAVDQLKGSVPRLIVDAGYGDLARALAREVVGAAGHFATIMSCGSVRIRLEVIETDACRRFHADFVTVRLLMPLAGPGTQWLHAGTDGPVQQLQAGEIGLFKGRRWAEESRILHRSPPVMQTGETRLLLAIDPLTSDDVV